MFIEILASVACVYAVSVLYSIFMSFRFKRAPKSPLKLRWFYRMHSYEIALPPKELSAYNGRFSSEPSEDISMICSLDDPYILQIAEDFEDIFGSKSPRFQAHCLQAMIQQNIEYATAFERFGDGDMICFPVHTLSTAKGNCGDTAVLYASIGTSIGLDVSILEEPVGHRMCGVRLGDKRYIVELTSSLPFFTAESIYTISREIIPLYPDSDFENRTYSL